MNIFVLLMGLLPSAIRIVEDIAGTTKGNGAVKKAAVTDIAKTAVYAVATTSTGGQAHTWETLAPSVSTAIDALVDVANTAGAFGDTSDPTGMSGTPQ